MRFRIHSRTVFVETPPSCFAASTIVSYALPSFRIIRASYLYATMLKVATVGYFPTVRTGSAKTFLLQIVAFVPMPFRSLPPAWDDSGRVCADWHCLPRSLDRHVRRTRLMSPRHAEIEKDVRSFAGRAAKSAESARSPNHEIGAPGVHLASKSLAAKSSVFRKRPL
jgi:hypothetical protein